MSNIRPATRRIGPSAVVSEFTEAPAWNPVGPGWRPLFGRFRELGFSFEWHEFTTAEELNWSRSFHPGSVELCINLDGTGAVSDGQQSVKLRARALTFYFQGDPPLIASREPNQLHRFITLEFSPEFLRENCAAQADNLHPIVRAVVRQEARTARVASPEPINAYLLQVVESLRHCPVFKPAQELWFRSKALEVAAQLFFRPPDGELLCRRAQRAARERVERVRGILKAEIHNPPSLEDLGRLVGCSPYYLSRQFSAETGITMQQYVRQIRLERAAELLRSGKCNVTEAALEVGYNSLSHFTSAFREAFGCCPGLYPMKLPRQQDISE